MRSKAINPKMGMAPNQINQRLFMAALIPLIRLFKSYLMFVSSKDIGYMSRFNSVMKYALKNAMSMVGSVATIDFLNIKIGSGTYYPLVNVVWGDATAGQDAGLLFGPVANGYKGLDSDRVTGFCYNSTQNKIYALTNDTIENGSIVTTGMTPSAGDVLYFYVYSYPASDNPISSFAFHPSHVSVLDPKRIVVSE
jgi:hypothetical protein